MARGYQSGARLDGKRIRRHVQGRTQGQVRKKLDELKKARDAGEDLAAPREPTVAEWAKTWMELVERTCKPSTVRTYRTHIKYLTPIRRVRLDKLTPEHIESIYVGLIQARRQPGDGPGRPPNLPVVSWRGGQAGQNRP